MDNPSREELEEKKYCSSVNNYIQSKCVFLKTEPTQEDKIHLSKKLCDDHVDAMGSDKVSIKRCAGLVSQKSNTSVQKLDQAVEDEVLHPLDLCTAQIDDGNVGDNSLQQLCTLQTGSKGRRIRREFIVGLSENGFACEECGKVFTQKGNLKIHLRIHTGAKPYTCEVCQRSFRVKLGLDQHMRTHTGERPFECNMCEKKYKIMKDLMCHKLSHSGERPYSCGQCNKQYRHKSALVHHLRMHAGEKRYVCNECNKSFAQVNSLTEHKRIHTGERPYTCEICNRTFKYRSHINKHRKMHRD